MRPVPLVRCLVISVVTALITVGLAACGAVPGSPAPVPTIVPTAAPTIVPTAAPNPSTAPACGPKDLVAVAFWQGATGQRAGWLTVTNAGSAPCILNGSPHLVQLRSGTTSLNQVIYTSGKGAGPGDATGDAGPVLLRSGGQAQAFMEWSNWCPQMIPVVTALLVTLPDGAGPVVAGPAPGNAGIGGVPRCDVPAAASAFTAYAFVPFTP